MPPLLPSREREGKDAGGGVVDLSFGLTVTLVGMGATFITILLITLIIRALDRLFPYGEETESKK